MSLTPQASSSPPTHDLIVHASTASFEETGFVLEQVLGFSFEDIETLFTKMARQGAVCALSSSPEIIQACLGEIALLNDKLENPIKATMEAKGFASQLTNKQTTTKGPSVVLSFKNFAFPKEDAKDVLVELLGTTEQYTKEELFLSDYDLYRMLEELQEGGEVLMKDFNKEENAEELATQLSEMLSQSLLLGMDEEDPSSDVVLDNIGIDVVPASSTLRATCPLMAMENILEDEEKAFFEELGEEGVLLQNGYIEQILEKHGNVADFLKQASAEEVAQYNKIIEKVAQVADQSPPKLKM